MRFEWLIIGDSFIHNQKDFIKVTNNSAESVSSGEVVYFNPLQEVDAVDFDDMLLIDDMDGFN
jgi:hypothetical protein